MNLFINVRVSPSYGGILKYDRGLLSKPSNYDVLIYTLKSYAVIPWDKVYLYIELTDEYAEKYSELEDLVCELFPTLELFYRWRNQYQSDWQTSISMIDEASTLLMCNHDHPFIDRNLEEFARIGEIKEEYFAVNLSHWSELLNECVTRKCWSGSHQHFVFENDGNHLPSTQLFSYPLLYSIWFDFDYKDSYLPRMDNVPGTNMGNAKSKPHNTYVPFRETLRHFDAYSHHAAYLPIACVPPLDRFNDPFRIRIGYEDRKFGHINLNPNKSYSCVDYKGSDGHYYEDNIPLFWRKNLAELDLNPDCDKMLLKRSSAKKNLDIAQAACIRYGNAHLFWENQELLGQSIGITVGCDFDS